MIIFSGKIHVIIAIVIWFFFPQLNLIFLILGSLFPDTDKKNSALGRIIPLWLFFKHRGFTHKIWAALGFSLLIYYALGQLIASSFFVGYVSHIVSDALKR